MTIPLHIPAHPRRRLPVVLTVRSVFIALILFLLCGGTGIITPVTALDPENQTLMNGLMSRGYECFSTKNYDCAWASFEAAHRMDTNNSGVLFAYGYYLANAGNNNGALEKYDAALAISPQNYRIWYEKGKVLDKLWRFDESGTSFDRALELNPGLQVKAFERFPLSILFRNATMIVVLGGFFLLGIYIYFNERRRR